MRRGAVAFIVGAACCLLLLGCAQNNVPSGGRIVKITVPNLMSG
ncbi:MAG: hypothetical protein AB1512_00125 [Thermodesulfobacteriota bacterium]